MGKTVVCLLCVVAFAAAVMAQPPAATQNYNALIGGSDAIVLCSVDTAVIPALPTAAGGGGGGGARTGNATVNVKVTKVYTGTITDASLNLTIPLTANRPGGGGPGGGGNAQPTAWTPDVSVGKVVVIGLVKTQAGWGITPIAGGAGGPGGGGGAGSAVYPEAQATTIATAIAAYAVKATLTAPATALTIGDKVTVTISVKNTGTTALTLGSTGFNPNPTPVVTLKSTQASAKLVSPATFVWVSDDTKDAAGAAKTVAAGAEATITAVFTVNGPANWQMFDTKVFPMASQISATVNLTQPRAGGGGGGGGGMFGTPLTAKTAWVDAQLVAPKP